MNLMQATVGAGLSVAFLSGCSQLAVLQPVAGDEIASVQIATSDVLTNSKVAVRTWPKCEVKDDGYLCVGRTAAGAPIESKATGEPLWLQVTVKGKRLYSGQLKQVITSAARQ